MFIIFWFKWYWPWCAHCELLWLALLWLVCHLALSVNIFINIFSESAHWICTTLLRNDPLVVPYRSCSKSASWWQKETAQKIGFKNIDCNHKVQSFRIWYNIINFYNRLIKLYILCPKGHSFTQNYVGKLFNNFLTPSPNLIKLDWKNWKIKCNL